MAYKLKTAGASVALALAFVVGVVVGRNFGPIDSQPDRDSAPHNSRLLDSMDMNAAIEGLAATGECSEPYRGEGQPPTNFCERAKRALAAERREGTR